MNLTPYEQVEAERRKRRWSRVQAAEFFGTTKQAYGNWRSRGIPLNRYARVADFLRCTVDEVFGRVETRRPQGSAEQTMLYGYGVTEEGAQLAAEWQKLDPSSRAAVRTLIESLVANQRREERAKARSTTRRSEQRDTN